jgi:hypothetical protein
MSTAASTSYYIRWHDPAFNIRTDEELQVKSAQSLPLPPDEQYRHTKGASVRVSLCGLFDDNRKSDLMMRLIRADLAETYLLRMARSSDMSRGASAAGDRLSSETGGSSMSKKGSSDGGQEAENDDSATSSKGSDHVQGGGRVNGRTLRRRPAFGKLSC